MCGIIGAKVILMPLTSLVSSIRYTRAPEVSTEQSKVCGSGLTLLRSNWNSSSSGLMARRKMVDQVLSWLSWPSLIQPAARRW
ncbi:hypothetical protein B0J13DRAFT_552946 [Dactylonectria estremocensis]|uniref:Secreted protein n=1 Tax=Dactylonectria estremocensis TaxID=1079267 RepID=A0A9P9J301_9HYPO|nr:hypothetical protein B0J13DRAFT_552946 [Dactylonectria estremocensis]